MTSTLRHRVRQAATWTAVDVQWGARLWVVNGVAGHRLVPRLLRHLIYRCMALDIDALDIASGVVITGGAGLHVGADCYVNHGVYFEAAGGITVGRGCAIGPEVMVLSTSHPVTHRGWRHEIERTPTTIGEDVWIGARAMILPGSHVPAGSMVSAGAVVRGVLVGSGVYAGDPARLVAPFPRR